MTTDRKKLALADKHQQERCELLRLARWTIEEYIAHGLAPWYETENAWFRRRAAVFVTLRVLPVDFANDGENAVAKGLLRGCVGQIEADKMLFEAVQDAAVKAAMADPRFPPVGAKELASLYVEISVLSRLSIVKSLSEIELGKHGLLIVGLRRRGLLLPEVPLAYGWRKEEYLTSLCRKAGLPEHVWPDQARLFRFTAESFSEACEPTTGLG